MSEIKTKAAAERAAGTIGHASKMPGTTYGTPAAACITGSKLAKIEGTICADCYAMKGNYIYPSVQTAQERRLASLTNPLWVPAMVKLIRHAHTRGKVRDIEIESGNHRWSDSGDLQSLEHLEKICEVCELTPEIEHWLSTREIGFVLAYRAKHGTEPKNLCIRVSANKVNGAPTNRWEQTSMVHDGTMPLPAGVEDCPSRFQDGKCGACRKCWNKAVKCVAYFLH